MSFLVTGLTLLVPMFAGYLCVRYGLVKRGWSKRLQRGTVLLLAPPVMFLAMWSLRIPGADIIGVPIVAILCGIGGMAVAYPIARGLRLSRQGAGAFIIAAGWSNTWLIGGYLCFLLFGQQGFALASLYNVLNPPLTYIVGFSVAGAFSPDHTVISTRDALRRFFTDPVSIMPNVGLLAGLGLNLAGSSPGTWSETFSTYVVPTFTVISMFAVGMTMSFRRTREFLRPIVAQSVVKFVLWPAITLGAAFLFRGSLWHDPTTFRVLMVQAFMPVSMQALMLCNLFDLDMDLVNACWLGTNLFSMITLPALVYFARL